MITIIANIHVDILENKQIPNLENKNNILCLFPTKFMETRQHEEYTHFMELTEFSGSSSSQNEFYYYANINNVDRNCYNSMFKILK